MQKRHYIIFFLVLMMLFQMVNTDNMIIPQKVSVLNKIS